MLELAHPLDAVPQPSPLRQARERRDLTVRAVALRSGLTEEEIDWLEESRIYRFPSQRAAILAAVLYRSALGIDKAEARRPRRLRLARQLGVPTASSPGLAAKQLLVIVGPKTVAAAR